MPASTTQLARFLAAFDPAVAKVAKQALAKLTKRLPGAHRLVYDNYNALAIGFSPTERASDVIVSIALYPRWASLFFLQNGPQLPDPEKRLRGSGARVRHVVLDGAATLDEPAIVRLLAHALARAKVPLDPQVKGKLVIKSISPKQRPRRPSRKGRT